MNTPLITWCCIAIAMIIIFILRVCHNRNNTLRTNRKFIEIGSEREEIFVPGDRLHPDTETYDYNDDND